MLNGEIVAVDENGIPLFQLLQRFQKQPTAATLYFVFDVLWANGADVTSKTLLKRRALLESIIKPAAGIQLGNYVERQGKALFDLTKTKGMEGIVAKRRQRLPAWETQSRLAQDQFQTTAGVCGWRIY